MLKQRIREKIHKQYPFLDQSLVRDLVSMIEQYKFYLLRDGKVALRMSPLLQFLKTNPPTTSLMDSKRKQLILRHLTNPIPPLTSHRQMDEMDLLLGASKSAHHPTRWKDVFFLIRLAYKYRHHLSCLSTDTTTTHNTLTIQKDGHVLRITPTHTYLDNKIVSLDYGLPMEREIARQLLLHYLQCVQTIYANKAHIINEVMYGSQRIGFLPPTQAVRSRAVSKQITHQPPRQQASKKLRQTVEIPLHVIKCCRLDEIINFSPEISADIYEHDVQPHLSELHAEGGFEIRQGTNINNLLDVLFPPHTKTCMTYVFAEHDALEVYIYCRVKILNQSYHGVFITRFYNDFLEFTEMTVQRSTNTIMGEITGDDDNMLQYNHDEEDLFLGWDIEKDTMTQYQTLRKQAIRTSRLPDRSDPIVKNFVYLFQHAIQTQKTKKIINMPEHHLSDWSEDADEQNVYLFPTLS